jgi:hypothetical protein
VLGEVVLLELELELLGVIAGEFWMGIWEGVLVN